MTTPLVEYKVSVEKITYRETAEKPYERERSQTIYEQTLPAVDIPAIAELVNKALRQDRYIYDPTTGVIAGVMPG